MLLTLIQNSISGSLPRDHAFGIIASVASTLNFLLHAKIVVVIVFVYCILSRLLYLAFSANLGLLCMLHLGMGPLV